MPPREHDHLSSGDALFLYLEREGTPLNVASVSIFESEIPLGACRKFIASKLPLIPRYQQRVAPPPFNIGLPTWEYDPEFDIRNHVREVRLTRGTENELKAVAGKILSQVMNRQRPLWDFTLVRGLKGNRTAVVTRIHHCLADGLAGVALMNVLMDANAEAPRLGLKAKARRPKAKGPATLLGELVTSSFSVAQRILTAQMEISRVFEQALTPAGETGTNGGPRLDGLPADEMAGLISELTGMTQRLPFNVICRGPQKFRWAEIPLAELKAVKEAYGATLNEVVLTLMTAVIRRYSELRGVRVKGRLLRIVVPVNVRGNGSATELGNQITFLPVTIPMDIRHPRKLLRAVQKRMMFLKAAHVAECVGITGTMLGTIPTAAQMVMGPMASRVPLGLCNTICTNVPGPTSPLYLIGHKMVSCYPYVPIGGDLGLNCAMLTYNGVAYFGMTADRAAVPEVARLEKFLITGFAELQESAGLGRARKRQRFRRGARPGETPAAWAGLGMTEHTPKPVTATAGKDDLRASVGA